MDGDLEVGFVRWCPDSRGVVASCGRYLWLLDVAAARAADYYELVGAEWRLSDAGVAGVSEFGLSQGQPVNVPQSTFTQALSSADQTSAPV